MVHTIIESLRYCIGRYYVFQISVMMEALRMAEISASPAPGGPPPLDSYSITHMSECQQWWPWPWHLTFDLDIWHSVRSTEGDHKLDMTFDLGSIIGLFKVNQIDLTWPWSFNLWGVRCANWLNKCTWQSSLNTLAQQMHSAILIDHCTASIFNQHYAHH